MRRHSQQGIVAAAVMLALLLPVLPDLLPECASMPAPPRERDNGAPLRCPGLWSADCCDYGPAPVLRYLSGALTVPAAPAVAPVLLETVSTSGAYLLIRGSLARPHPPPPWAGSCTPFLLGFSVLLC